MPSNHHCTAEGLFGKEPPLLRNLADSLQGCWAWDVRRSWTNHAAPLWPRNAFLALTSSFDALRRLRTCFDWLLQDSGRWELVHPLALGKILGSWARASPSPRPAGEGQGEGHVAVRRRTPARGAWASRRTATNALGHSNAAPRPFDTLRARGGRNPRGLAASTALRARRRIGPGVSQR